MIEARPGILILLDEEGLRPGDTNDQTLVDKFNTHLNKNNFMNHGKRIEKKRILKITDILNQKTTSNTGQSVHAIDAKFNETLVSKKTKLYSMYKTK